MILKGTAKVYLLPVFIVMILSFISCTPGVKDTREKTVASVGGEAITVKDIREMFGVRAAVYKVFSVSKERKREALERLIAGKLLAEESRRHGNDKSDEFKQRYIEGEKDLYIAVLFKERVDRAVRVENEKIRAEAQKLMGEDGKLGEDDAINRATQVLYQNAFREKDNLLIQEVKGSVRTELQEGSLKKIESGEDVGNDTAIAMVNGTPISYGEVKGELAKIAGHGGKDLEKDIRAISAIVERISIREGLYNYAKKEEVNKSEIFKNVKNNFESSIMIDLLIKNNISKGVTVTEEEVKRTYDEHPEMFEQGAKVKARHILVGDEKRALEIHEKIKSGADFKEMAKKFSKDSSAAKGGDLGSFGRGVMVKPFEDVAFSLKVGMISEPVKTEFGYHIIQVTEREKGKITPFPKAKDQLKEFLLNKRVNAQIQTLVENLKEKAEVKINESMLDFV